MYKNLCESTYIKNKRHINKQKAKSRKYRDIGSTKWLSYNFDHNTAAKAAFSCHGHGGKCKMCRNRYN